MNVTRKVIKAATFGDLKKGSVFETKDEYGEQYDAVYMVLGSDGVYLEKMDGKGYAADVRTGDVYVFDNDFKVYVRDSELVIEVKEGF